MQADIPRVAVMAGWLGCRLDRREPLGEVLGEGLLARLDERSGVDGVDPGWLLPNEARQLEDREPLPGLDPPADGPGTLEVVA